MQAQKLGVENRKLESAVLEENKFYQNFIVRMELVLVGLKDGETVQLQ